MSSIADLAEAFFKANPELIPGQPTDDNVTVWCIDAVAPFMHLVAFQGTGYRLTNPTAWVREGTNTEVNVALPDNPTWNQLREAVEAGIKQSGDRHHVFIESFEVNHEAKTVEVWMGS